MTESSTPPAGGAPLRESLLATKLVIPPARPSLVPRSRLFNQLSRALNYQLTLVSAPAGSGKTTLLSDWASKICKKDVRIAWISLDASDNDPSHFFTYLASALEVWRPGIALRLRPLLEAGQSLMTDSILAVLLNSLTAKPPSSSVGACRPQASTKTHDVLVLDDYHVIDSETVHKALAFFIEHLPPTMHLVIASRVDPPLPLARLRVRNLLLEIRTEDLRFGFDETWDFLQNVMGLNLSPSDVASLERHTEGWVAGLQLSALSMQKTLPEDITGFIQALSGRSRHMADYLVSEVLEKQSAEIQTFLLRSSILEHLTASLCDTVLEQNHSQSVLEQLEQTNMFIIPLDSQGGWYRYHHLFRELLQARLEELSSDFVPVLHQRASEWYAAHSFPTEAITHALAARDYARAAELIHLHAYEMQHRSELAKHLNWLDALPIEIISSRPQLWIVRAWALLGASQIEEIESALQMAERALDSEPTEAISIAESEQVRYEILVLRATAATIEGDVARGVELSERALNQMSAVANRRLRRMIAYNLATASELSGEAVAAAQALREAIPIALADGSFSSAVSFTVTLGRLQRDQGRLREASDLYVQALATAAEKEIQETPAAGFAQIEMGQLLREKNQFESAARHLTKGLELMQGANYHTYAVDAYIALARIQEAQGQLDRALEIIENGEKVLGRHCLPRASAKMAVYRAHLWLAQGNPDAVATWARTERRRTDVKDYRLEDAEQTVLARLLASQGRIDEALEIVIRLRQRAETSGRHGNALQFMVVQSLLLQSQGKEKLALDLLDHALSLAAPEGYFRLFVDEGAPMATLLRKLAKSWDARQTNDPDMNLRDYANGLLAELGHGPYRRGKYMDSEFNLSEPLTDREAEVAQLIAAGLSYRKIAQKLCISVNTVKTHARSIFAKTGSKDRIEFLVKPQETIR